MALSRRDFLSLSGRSALLAGSAALVGPRAATFLRSGRSALGSGGALMHPLARMNEASPTNLVLKAAEGQADCGGGVLRNVFALNGSVPSPLLRTTQGETFNIRMENHLKGDLILHWHGLTPPEQSDGHPKYAVPSGSSYDYGFELQERPGLYWYHSHTHLKTSEHTFKGIGGLILVQDPKEESLGLPVGEREIPMVLQDRQVDEEGRPAYPDQGYGYMGGYMGPEIFGNGVHRPFVELDTALYRFRMLNGSNARTFRLERSDGRPFVVIGNDGGLLDRPYTVQTIDFAPAERLDLLMDFSDVPVGQTIMLRSARFEMPADSQEIRGFGAMQGDPLDLVELRVTRKVSEKARIPESFAAVPGPDAAQSVKERRFKWGSDRDYWTRSMMQHQINGKIYEMDRIDFTVPFGQTEIWTFQNDGRYAHPVHIHSTHFKVISRTGGRNQVFPWESGGLKDTVLMFPGETVKIAVAFTAQRGEFLLHCHNLEHEDAGMMTNFTVE
jgi:FtsP/CotA-like multicopper oxidase with cupredoxin domain